MSKNIICLLLAACCWLAALPALAQSDVLNLPPTISDIKIQGNQAIPSAEIMKVVFSRVGDGLLEEKVKSDLKAIYALGFFADATVSFEAAGGGTVVIFQVKENPVIADVALEGNTVFGTAEILSWLANKRGQILNYKKLQEDIQTINSRYQESGYMLARVVDVETDERTNILHLKIVEGYVEAIALAGNESTKDYVILRELNTTPGSILNEQELKKDLRRVFNLGFFSEVTPHFEPGTNPDALILKLDIKETRSSTINFGGGYGEREGWFGFADLSINNLMGTAQGLMIRGQSGQDLSTYQLKYTNPWFMPERFGKRTALTFRRWYTVGRDIYLTQQDAKYNGFDVAVGRPWLEYFSTAWTIGSELVNPYGASTFESYQADTIGYSLYYDTRDFWLNPSEGAYYSLDLKQGWKYTATTNSFFKLGWDLNRYLPVQPNQVLAMHGGAGIGFGDVPIGELYWAGGANTVRGYYPTEALRGTRKLIFNIEYRLNFSEMFQGVLFYDWGNVWNSGAPVPADFISGWGPGVRINTPLGPIRLDWGVPKDKTFGEGVMHFSIGQAF